MGAVPSPDSSASWFSALLSAGHCCANILKATALLQESPRQSWLVQLCPREQLGPYSGWLHARKGSAWFLGQNHKQTVTSPTDADQHLGAKHAEPDSGAKAGAVPGHWQVMGPSPSSGCTEECISDVPRHSRREEITCFLSFQGKTKTTPPAGKSFLFVIFFVEGLHLHVAAFLHI